MQENRFDFSKDHFSALHRVSQIEDLASGDVVAIGTTINDHMIAFDKHIRAIDLNIVFAMKIGSSR